LSYTYKDSRFSKKGSQKVKKIQKYFYFYEMALFIRLFSVSSAIIMHFFQHYTIRLYSILNFFLLLKDFLLYENQILLFSLILIYNFINLCFHMEKVNYEEKD